MSMNRQIVLKRRPEGLVSRDDFEVVDAKLPEPGENEALIETLYLGMDATVRTWLSKAEGYIPPVEIGEVVRCSGIGRVLETSSEKVPVGALVATLTGWQQRAVVGDDPMLTTVLAEGADPLAELSVFGSAGMTAYVGLTEVGKVRDGETVVVSAAAGATGSTAVQIAKILGARVIGVAGSDEKCRWLVDDLGADGAINYRSDDLAAKIKEFCPKGVDVFFDNTGGPILDAVLGRIANGGRGAVRRDLVVQRPSQAAGPGQLPQPHQPARQHAGLHLVGLLGTLGGDHRPAARGCARDRCATARTSSKDSSPPPTRSTRCSPARTSARSSSNLILLAKRATGVR